MSEEDKILCLLTITNNCMIVQSAQMEYVEVIGYPNSGDAERMYRLYTKFIDDDTLKRFDCAYQIDGQPKVAHHFYFTVRLVPSMFLVTETKDRYGHIKRETPIVTFMHQLLYCASEIRKIDQKQDLFPDVRRYITMEHLPRHFIAFFHVMCGKKLTTFGTHMKNLLIKFDKIFMDDKKNKKKLAMEIFVRAILGINYYKTNTKRSDKIRTAVRRWYKNTVSSYRVKEGLSDEVLQRLVDNEILTEEDVTTVKSELIFLKL